MPQNSEFDVIIIGGALSGAATALLLLRDRPHTRVLIVEKSEKFGRRVGEATVEVSGWFLGRCLGLTQHLNEHHLCKQGLRFWHANDRVKTIDQASEIGPKYLARLPSYQVDRSTLDQEVLDRAVAAGTELLRPANVSEIRLEEGGRQRITVKQGEGTTDFTARWIVDASGLAALVARKERWLEPLDAHPTAAAWARWKGIGDWDGRELAERYPDWFSRHFGTRATATNHIVGDGWWSWWIPLKGGDVSMGLVFDQRLVEFPQADGGIAGRIRAFLDGHPVAREMMRHATANEGDIHWRKNLPYRSKRFAQDGCVLVGDAAAFIDPFYSPGMDWISYTSSMAVKMMRENLAGADARPLVAEYNRLLESSFTRWFDALYRDKYHYLGEHDLLSLAYRLDITLYYWGVVDDVFDRGRVALESQPPFSHPASGPFARLMKTYNRRFAAIAARRRRIGKTGRTNDGRHDLVPGFQLGRREIRKVIPLLWQWLKLEAREGWKSWGTAASEPAASLHREHGFEADVRG